MSLRILHLTPGGRDEQDDAFGISESNQCVRHTPQHHLVRHAIGVSLLPPIVDRVVTLRCCRVARHRLQPRGRLRSLVKVAVHVDRAGRQLAERLVAQRQRRVRCAQRQGIGATSTGL